MARRVRRLPAAPTMEMTMQLELNYNAIMEASFGVTFISHIEPVAELTELLYG